ncbi:hypothetical protein V2J09_003506 [Rumex salicifolius]
MCGFEGSKALFFKGAENQWKSSESSHVSATALTAYKFLLKKSQDPFSRMVKLALMDFLADLESCKL